MRLKLCGSIQKKGASGGCHPCLVRFVVSPGRGRSGKWYQCANLDRISFFASGPSSGLHQPYLQIRPTLPLALAQSRSNLRCSPPPREECHENLVFQGLEADRLEAFRSSWQGRGSQSARSLLSRINGHSNFPHVSCLVGIHYTAGWNSLRICIAYCKHPAFDRCAC